MTVDFASYRVWEKMLLVFLSKILEAEEILETCQNSLDDLWKLDDFVYPQKRMIHLMDIIANAVTRYVQVRLFTARVNKLVRLYILLNINKT